MKCPFCNAEIEESYSFCCECGKSIPKEPIEEVNAMELDETIRSTEAPAVPVCPSCGKEYHEGDKFCLYCGQPLSGQAMVHTQIQERGNVDPFDQTVRSNYMPEMVAPQPVYADPYINPGVVQKGKRDDTSSGKGFNIAGILAILIGAVAGGLLGVLVTILVL